MRKLESANKFVMQTTPANIDRDKFVCAFMQMRGNWWSYKCLVCKTNECSYKGIAYKTTDYYYILKTRNNIKNKQCLRKAGGTFNPLDGKKRSFI